MQPSAQQWIDKFLQHLNTERRLSPHTLSNYQRDLRGIGGRSLARALSWQSFK